MIKVFNSFALSAKQRFIRALLVGIPTALGLGFLYGLLTLFIPIRFSIVYVGIGYLIGEVIRINGRGVQVKFSVLAAALALISFLLSDAIAMFGLNPSMIVGFMWILPLSYLNSLNGLIHIAFMAFGAFTAYQKARIL